MSVLVTRSAGEVAVAMNVTKALQDVHFICNFVWSRVNCERGGGSLSPKLRSAVLFIED